MSNIMQVLEQYIAKSFDDKFDSLIYDVYFAKKKISKRSQYIMDFMKYVLCVYNIDNIYDNGTKEEKDCIVEIVKTIYQWAYPISEEKHHRSNFLESFLKVYSSKPISNLLMRLCKEYMDANSNSKTTINDSDKSIINNNRCLIKYYVTELKRCMITYQPSLSGKIYDLEKLSNILQSDNVLSNNALLVSIDNLYKYLVEFSRNVPINEKQYSVYMALFVKIELLFDDLCKIDTMKRNCEYISSIKKTYKSALKEVNSKVSEKYIDYYWKECNDCRNKWFYKFNDYDKNILIREMMTEHLKSIINIVNSIQFETSICKNEERNDPIRDILIQICFWTENNEYMLSLPFYLIESDNEKCILLNQANTPEAESCMKDIPDKISLNNIDVCLTLYAENIKKYISTYQLGIAVNNEAGMSLLNYQGKSDSEFEWEVFKKKQLGYIKCLVKIYSIFKYGMSNDKDIKIKRCDLILVINAYLLLSLINPTITNPFKAGRHIRFITVFNTLKENNLDSVSINSKLKEYKSKLKEYKDELDKKKLDKKKKELDENEREINELKFYLRVICGIIDQNAYDYHNMLHILESMRIKFINYILNLITKDITSNEAVAIITLAKNEFNQKLDSIDSKYNRKLLRKLSKLHSNSKRSIKQWL